MSTSSTRFFYSVDFTSGFVQMYLCRLGLIVVETQVHSQSGGGGSMNGVRDWWYLYKSGA